MKRASVRDLHVNTSKWVHEAAEGRVIVIESRGKPVAELRPLSKARLPEAAKRRILAEMEEFWVRMPQMPDSGPLVEEDRDRF
jgi:antitoxin (DNA-binding transcriptional repressor) of toxin-antitoxin stability system